MLYSLKNLRSLELEGGTAWLSGDHGKLKVTIHGPHIVSIFYVFDESLAPAESNRAHPALFSPAWEEENGRWDGILELESEYELCAGSTRLHVDKATARVAVYEGETLEHGGEIGHKDLVVPQYPLRVQMSEDRRALRGKFNFRLEEGDAFFGLGEKTGALNKRNRTFKLFNRDALGYNAEASDPLYKSVPFFIKMNRDTGTLCGIFFPNLMVDEVNFGVESIFYYDVVLAGGPFGYFVLTGRGYRDILASYCEITGKPALPPLFSFGYLTSSMGYTDPDNAQERVLQFFSRVEAEDIPCEGMYFSSGYVKADNGERYTFVWNREKFPEPEKFIRALRDRGYRICCNVKPGILKTHPWYDELAAQGVFIPDADNTPLKSYYWGNSASFVDFSRKEGYDWWVKALTEHIVDQGVTGVWNDNNEFEIEDDSLKIQSVKKILPVLMAQASYEALRAANPGARPWLISRAGYTGLQRYARTWTGDNVSSYMTFLRNIAMGMNLGLSGMPMYGHDIGGFVGSDPDEELLLRWCQSAIFQPRFVMHSWKPDGSITEPWSYPSRTYAVRRFIRERYRFLPYIYDVAIRASETGAPMESPVALEFPLDVALSFESLDRMAGDAVLVPGPPERGQSRTRVRLPKGEDWFDPWKGILHRGGEDLECEYPIDEPRYFFRCGTVIPTAPRIGSVGTTQQDGCEFIVVPPSGFQKPAGFGAGSGRSAPACVHSEDDGESDFVPGNFWRWRMEFIEIATDETLLDIVCVARREQLPYRKFWRFVVPDGFTLIDSEGNERGQSFAITFENAPEHISVRVRGEYRTATH